MADIPGIPYEEPRPPRRKRRVTTSPEWIERGPLAPWMLAYAQWLVTLPTAELTRTNAPKGYRRGPPTTSERTAKASQLAHRRIVTRMVRVLETRPDFREYFEKLRADTQYRAREMMQEDIARNIELRRQGLEDAAKAGDHRAIKGYTDWVPEVAFPKKLQGEEQAPRVVINITGNADAKALIGKVLGEEEEIQDVEYDVIEPKQLTDGEED